MSSALSSTEGEIGVIGSILLDPENVLSMCAEVGLTKDAFVSTANQLMFRVCDYLRDNAKPIDPLTVMDQLKKYGKMDDVGGAAYIDHVIEATPTAAHAAHYIELVRNSWIFRRIAESGSKMTDMVREPDADPHTLLAAVIDELSSIGKCRQASTKASAMQDVLRDCDAARGGKMPGLMTPWRLFNQGTAGIPFGLVTVFGGRGGTRKSYLVNQLATYASVTSEDAVPGAYFPLEDGVKIAMRRSACMIAKVDAWQYMRGAITDEEYDKVRDAGRRLVDSRLDFRGGRGMNVKQIALEAARGVAKHGWRYILIDAFKDIRSSGGDIGVSEVYKSAILADIAERHDMAVMVVHHIKKATGQDGGRIQEDEENKRLVIQDIKGRGEITDDARMVNILQCRQRRNKIDGGMELYDFELDVLKNSHGPTAKVDLVLDKALGLFTER